MLVTDPRNRASLQEIMTHPWISKGYPSPVENYLPVREPLTLPLDPTVVNGMTGFEFGSSETVIRELTKLISSEEYQNAIRLAQREAPLSSSYPEKKKGFGFDFYKRRSSTSSKDTLTNASSELLTPYARDDPVNAYNPLVSVYYLVREKLERDNHMAAPGATPPLASADVERIAQAAAPRQPEAAYTSQTSYELKGETAITSGRTRPRARTHGDDEVSEAMKKVNLGAGASSGSPMVAPPPREHQPPPAPVRKDLSVGGMFRRLSTRRHSSRGESTKSSESQKVAPPTATPTLNLPAPEQPPSSLSKSLSVRHPKEATRRNSTQPGQAPDLLTPPASADGLSNITTKPLGRSTSVSEAEWRKRYTRPRASMEPPRTGGSPERSVSANRSSADKSFAVRAKSVGHAKRETIQSRRSKRDGAEGTAANADDTQGDDNADAATSAGSGDIGCSSTPSADFIKPVFLKGLFSVSTTSTKPPLEIRKDIIRVLKQLGVSYKEIRGGFVCVHRPSIDLKSVVECGNQPEATNMVSASSHRRKISYGGTTSSSNQGSSSKQASRRGKNDTSYSNSDDSNESVNDGVLGGSLILQFEIYIVKVPLLAIHGIQFKSVNKTNTWQYKGLASRILAELRL